MPNTGKPSQDCHLCRSRRVKCDLARPGCQRCFKYGAQCPGYRDQQDLMFRSEDPMRGRKKTQSRAKQLDQQQMQSVVLLPATTISSSSSSSPPLPGQHSSSSSGKSFMFIDGSSSSSSSSAALSAWEAKALLAAKTGAACMAEPHLYMPVTEHWTSHSVPIMLNVYAPIEFLSDIYSHSLPDGPLVWAAHLFSRTYVTNLRYPTAMCRASYDETQRELGMYLGKTLGAVGAALKKPAGAMRDDILATVWTLANYETLMGSLNRTHLLSPWHTHARGLYSILKTRGEESLRQESSRAAFWSSYTMVQIDCLAGTLPCPEESTRWFKVIKSSMTGGEQHPIIVGEFILKISHLQSDMLTIVRRNDYEMASRNYHALVEGVIQAENEADILFTRVTDRPNLMDSFWRQMYCSAKVKCYHVTQLYINFLSHYRHCPATPREMELRRELCIQRVRAAAQDILDTMPMILEPLISNNDKSPKMLFDALMIIWPLSAVYITPSVLPEQIGTAETALLFIGRELGVKQALSAYPGTAASRVPPQAMIPRGFGECEMADWVGRLR